MKLADALHRDRVVLDLSAVDKVTTLQELLRVAAATLDLTDTGPLRSGSSTARRSVPQPSTGGWPSHTPARRRSTASVVASLGIHRDGLDYNSPDGDPVHLIFLVLSSEIATPAYLSVLGRTARIFHREEMRRLVLNARSEDDIIRAITDQEPA